MTADVDGAAGSGQGEERLGVLPRNRLAVTAAVAEDQPQPRLPVALAPQLALAHRVDAADALPILERGKRHPRRDQCVGESLLFHRNPK
jgi:hypothetical protein